MKIAFSGPANSGKTTLIKQFINKWPMYKTPVHTYRDKLKELNLEHSDKTSEKVQSIIFESMDKQLDEFKDEQYIVYDRCPLDCLVYTLQANQSGLVSDDFVTDMVEKVRDSLSKLDIIFVNFYNPNFEITDNGVRNTDVKYIKRTNEIFNNIMLEYYNNFDDGVLFPKDCPGIIALEHEDKLIQIAGLVNPRGDLPNAEDDRKLNQMFSDSVGQSLDAKKKMEDLIGYMESAKDDKIDEESLKYDKVKDLEV